MNKKDLQNKVQKMKLMALVATAVGGTSLNASAQVTSENENHINKTEQIQSDSRTISSSFGNIKYTVTNNGVEFDSNVQMFKVGAIMPNLYDCDDGSIDCGPLNSFNEKNLLNQTERDLRGLVVEEAIAQDIQNKSGVISEGEMNFLAKHNKKMKDWGLTAKALGNGKVEITQSDPMLSGHLSFQMNSAQIVNYRNFDQTR